MSGLDYPGPAHGEGIARRFKVVEYQVRSTTCLKTAQITATRLRADAGQTEMTEPVPTERAFVVSHQLADLKHLELWKLGRHAFSAGYARGTTSCVHLEEEPQAYLPHAYDGLMLHIPELALREVAESNDFPLLDRIMDDRHSVDHVTAALCRTLLPVLSDPQSTDQIFVDHLLMAFCSHLLANFSSTSRPAVKPGSLSSLQLRKAKDLLAANLSCDVSLAQVAETCDMTPVTFARAFRPHHPPRVQYTGQAAERTTIKKIWVCPFGAD